MNLAEFQDWLDARGADLGTWPAGARAEAERLVAGSEEARRALADARCLEGRLRAALMPRPAPAALRAAVLRVPQGHPRPAARSGWGWGLGLAWGSVAAALGSVVLGFVLGAGLLPPADDPLEALDVAALVYGAEEDPP